MQIMHAKVKLTQTVMVIMNECDQNFMTAPFSLHVVQW